MVSSHLHPLSFVTHLSFECDAPTFVGWLCFDGVGLCYGHLEPRCLSSAMVAFTINFLRATAGPPKLKVLFSSIDGRYRMSPFVGHLYTRQKEIQHLKTRRTGFNLKHLVVFWKTHKARFLDYLQTTQIQKLLIHGKTLQISVQIQEIGQLLLVTLPLGAGEEGACRALPARAYGQCIPR